MIPKFMKLNHRKNQKTNPLILSWSRSFFKPQFKAKTGNYQGFDIKENHRESSSLGFRQTSRKNLGLGIETR